MAKLTSHDYLVDLGSGDGVTVIAAAKRGVKALGIEYDPKPPFDTGSPGKAPPDLVELIRSSVG